MVIFSRESSAEKIPEASTGTFRREYLQKLASFTTSGLWGELLEVLNPGESGEDEQEFRDPLFVYTFDFDDPNSQALRLENSARETDAYIFPKPALREVDNHLSNVILEMQELRDTGKLDDDRVMEEKRRMLSRGYSQDEVELNAEASARGRIFQEKLNYDPDGIGDKLSQLERRTKAISSYWDKEMQEFEYSQDVEDWLGTSW